MAPPFVPQEFIIPEILETSEFRLRTLTVHDVVKDYDAVMTSVDKKVAFPGRDVEREAWRTIPDD